MTRYVIYRDGKHLEVEERIKEAVADFYRRHRALPVSVLVHPSEEDTARAALKALDLKMRVETSGGCLIPEVWLAVPEEQR